jgi:DNA-binding XRE family transcriptional regulator
VAVVPATGTAVRGCRPVSVMKGNDTLNSPALIESVARGLGMPEESREASGLASSSGGAALIPVQQGQNVDVGRSSQWTAARVKSPDHVGVRIAALRHERGLTQESLAERAGISVESVSKIEQQERSPSLTMLRMLADALGVPVGEVFGSSGLDKQPSEEQAEAEYRTSAGDGEL